MSVEKRSIALKQARPFGLREKSRHAVLEDLAREHHYLRPPPSLARFFAATRLATKRQQTLGFQAHLGEVLATERTDLITLDLLARQRIGRRVGQR